MTRFGMKARSVRNPECDEWGGPELHPGNIRLTESTSMVVLV
jgi:hypothetical protein